jgi:hypothetical protein
VSNLGPLQTNGATELTAEDIAALLAQFTFLSSRLLVDTNVSPISPIAIGSITSIPANTLTTIVTFTASSNINLSRIAVSGTDYAKFQLFKNTILIETQRSGPERSLNFSFNNPLKLVATDILDVKVTHYATGILADFESTVYGG